MLVEGRNCWRRARANRLAFLIDGAAYFDAFVRAVEKAERSILIVGWDVDSRTRLRPHRDDLGRCDELGTFLNTIVSGRPELHAHVINWDWAMLYAREREPLPILKLGWQTHQRVHFRLDDRHPMGGSQHEKIIVVDDRVAFLGGLDLTIHRWDTPEHTAHDERRILPSGKPYGPFHDVQVVVDGDAARRLGDLARHRWYRITGETLDPPDDATSDPWPDDVEPAVCHVEVGIARTRPRHDDQPEVREVERLILNIIESAQRFLYVENQYLTSATVGDALARRLAEDHGPEVVVVSRVDCSGWLEDSTMGVLRARILHKLRDADRRGRFRIYYPVVPDLGDDGIKVHTKLLMADDRWLRLGSSNLSNRSMGLDSECDLSLEAGEESRVADVIGGLRNRLLAEHLGASPERTAATLTRTGSLIATVESLRGGPRTLENLDGSVPEWLDRMLPEAAVIDPERPLAPEHMIDERIAEEARETVHRPLLRAGLVLLLAALLAALWRWSPLGELLQPDRLAAWALPWRESGLAPLAVTATYVLGGFFVFPVTVLILATVLLFGPFEGFLLALTGSLASAAATYPVGILLGRDTVRRLASPRLNRLSRRLVRSGVLAVATVRIVPVAPFTVVNLVAGAMHIPFGAYLLGTAVGMTPGLAALALFGDRLLAVARRPETTNIVLFIVFSAALFAGAAWLRRRSRENAARANPRAEKA